MSIKNLKGLTVEVYKGKWDSTNGGLSSKVTEITVVNLTEINGEDCDIFEASDTRPAFVLESHARGCLRLVPLKSPGEPKVIGGMFGGNYGATSDSRFGEACERLLKGSFYGAVAIHDRFETREEYRALSM